MVRSGADRGKARELAKALEVRGWVMVVQAQNFAILMVLITM